MLIVDNLHVHYGLQHALKGISLTVQPKEIVTLIGANGAGKTSIVMAISNLIRKSGGSVTFSGQDITQSEPSDIVKRGICHIPEGRLIFPSLTVEENLILGDFGNTDPNPNRLKENLDQVYQLFPRLKERRKQNGGTLSGGEQQMLAIGRGLMLDPQLIMLDEPSLGLAPIIVEQIFELILKIRDWGKTILLIEQNAQMALEIADRGLVIENGMVTLSGNAKTLATDPGVVAAYLGI